MLKVTTMPRAEADVEIWDESTDVGGCALNKLIIITTTVTLKRELFLPFPKTQTIDGITSRHEHCYSPSIMQRQYFPIDSLFFSQQYPEAVTNSQGLRFTLSANFIVFTPSKFICVGGSATNNNTEKRRQRCF